LKNTKISHTFSRDSAQKIVTLSAYMVVVNNKCVLCNLLLGWCIAPVGSIYVPERHPKMRVLMMHIFLMKMYERYDGIFLRLCAINVCYRS